MVRFEENYSLKKYNTFRIDAKTRYFFEYTEPKDLPDFLINFSNGKQMPHFVLGGGSNLLLVCDYDGIVIHPKVLGIKVVQEDENHVYLEVGAGEEWDDVVAFAVDHDWSGIENLSLIPGSAGAAAVQNIGAYGMEVSQVLYQVKGFDLQLLEERELPAADCAYAYRDSIFKHNLKEKFVIHTITLRLSKSHHFNVDYGSLKDEVSAIGELNLENIRRAIIKVRQSKLPDSKHIGSAGSFFMNPIVAAAQAEELLKIYPDMPTYSADGGKVKLAAGWLIEQCGWKGFRKGGAGVYEHQALVLVNHGEATGTEIADLAREIQQSVFQKFNVGILPEVYYLK
ncbi:MAG: UDP-N-acetylmuramate dehydrogenase [Mangrovibacterium sp.]